MRILLLFSKKAGIPYIGEAVKQSLLTIAILIFFFGGIPKRDFIPKITVACVITDNASNVPATSQNLRIA